MPHNLSQSTELFSVAERLSHRACYGTGAMKKWQFGSSCWNHHPNLLSETSKVEIISHVRLQILPIDEFMVSQPQ